MVGAEAAGFKMWVAGFFQKYRRDLFYASVAALALGVVIRNEMMRKGMVGRPERIDLRPKVEREFGNKNKG